MPRRGGFSILELVVAIGLLAVSLFFIVGIIPTGALSLRKAEDLQAATAYAVELIEDARTNFPTAATFPVVDKDFKVKLNTTEFHATRELSVLEEQGSYRLHQIVANVARADGQGSPVKLVTRLTVRTP